jgi:DNA primase
MERGGYGRDFGRIQMRIPDEKVQEVRDASSIVDVVSQYVSLKKRGKTFSGLCPFHQEKTPSFTVDPIRGFYHCFGCGEGGDVFSFIMKMEKTGFLEAVRTLADRVNIHLPSYEKEDARNQEIELLYRANQVAADFYRTCLWNTQDGKSALQYISKRGFQQKTLETFRIGYAPNQWDGLIKKAEQSGIKPEALLRAGLIVPRKDGRGHYDRFRGRLMFPIFNISGRVVGFGGRILAAAEGVPKYINTSETPIYQKSHILYGLFHSKNGIRRENRVLLVEGYTDMMRFYQCGFDYAVASSGTALTEGQAKLLTQYAPRVVLVFDGDSAGLRAAIRGIDVVLAAGLHVEIAALPKGTDPDAFLIKYGSDDMQKCLKDAFSFVDFQLMQMRGRSSLSNPIEKAEAARSLILSVSKIRDPMVRQIAIKDIAEKLDVEESVLLQELNRMPVQASGSVPEITPPVQKKSGRREKAEGGLIAFLLLGGESWSELVFRTLTPDFFSSSETRLLFEEISMDVSRGQSPDAKRLMDHFRENPKMTTFISHLLTEEMVQRTDISQFGLDCLLRILEEKYQEKMDVIKKRLKIEQAEGDDRAKHEWMNTKKVLENLKVEITLEWKKNVEI